MKSPTTALLWEIWRQHRSTVAVIAGLTVAGRFADYFETSDDSSPLPILLAMLAFLFLLGIFNVTDADGRGLGRYPRRLFTLPVTSLRLVAVPMLSGIASIEILYLLWLGPLSRGGTLSPPFVAVLLGATVVFYLWTIWAFERTGSLRLFILGAIAAALFAVGLLPSFPPDPPPPWRSETAIAGLVTSLAVVAFLLTWRHVARVRDGDEGGGGSIESLFDWMSDVAARPRTGFASPTSAHFWYEWRASGMVLPALVGMLLLVIILPASLLRGESTFVLLLIALASPVVLAIPVGIASSKATFWTEDLSIPAFVAVRPLTSADLIAIKVKVAAVSAALSWLVMLVLVTVWLSAWGNLEGVSRFALQMWAFYEHSTAAVYGIAVLVVAAGMFLTWRFMVARLWSGMSGARRLFLASVASVFVVPIAAMLGEAGDFWGWLFEDQARLAPFVWLAAVAVVAKYWLAAFTWRGVAPAYLRGYLLVWLVGTASFLGFGLVVWDVLRIYLPLDADRIHSIVILLALLGVPLARVGLAPTSLTRNRHQA